MTDEISTLPALVATEASPTRMATLNTFTDVGTFENTCRFAKAISESSMVPVEYQRWYEKDGQWFENRNAISNCIIAIDIARNLRDSPLTIMQNMDVVKGRPGFRGKFMIAKINASPDFGRVRWEQKGTEDPKGKDYGYRAVVKDKETGDLLYGPWVDWEMVRKEGWDGKSMSKWKSMPELMFQYRSASMWCSLYAPDLLMGLATSEEVEDISGVEPTRRRRGRAADLADALDRQDPPAGTSDTAKAADQAAQSAGDGSPTTTSEDADQVDEQAVEGTPPEPVKDDTPTDDDGNKLSAEEVAELERMHAAFKANRAKEKETATTQVEERAKATVETTTTKNGIEVKDYVAPPKNAKPDAPQSTLNIE